MRARLIAAAAIALSGIAQAASVKEGQPAPDFTLKLLVGGQKVSLDELKGQVVVLNFWATWCGPCRRELPLLDAYYKAQRAHGLRVFAVTTEDSVPTYKLRPLFEKLTIEPSKVAKGPYADLGAVPTNYVIDRAGKVRYMKAAAFDLDTLNTVLVPLLREPAPADLPASKAG
jgi:cytochrome c biogenesis protein CcmG, thiol:disulfide interchange protein DsbE